MGATPTTHEPDVKKIPEITDPLTEKDAKTRTELVAMFRELADKLEKTTTYKEVFDTLEEMSAKSETIGEDLVETMSQMDPPEEENHTGPTGAEGQE